MAATLTFPLDDSFGDEGTDNDKRSLSLRKGITETKNTYSNYLATYERTEVTTTLEPYGGNETLDFRSNARRYLEEVGEG